VPASGSQGLGSSLDRAREHLELPLTVDDLARQAMMSPRTYARRVRETTGTTPLQWLCAERVRRAQDLLENTDDTIERIATLCGFGSAHQMRTHFRRINRVTPQAYQRTFCPVSGIVARRDALSWPGLIKWQTAGLRSVIQVGPGGVPGSGLSLISARADSGSWPPSAERTPSVRRRRGWRRRLRSRRPRPRAAVRRSR
jgi:AraC-like DNA-binding protein